MTRVKTLVITNFSTHYRAPLFELMHQRLGAEFIFFSRGGENYWQPHLGVTGGGFPATTVDATHSIGKVRVNTSLWHEILSRDFDVMIKCINGRVELPLAYAAARRKGAAFVLWTGMWMHPRTPFHFMSRPLARQIYRHSDAIVTYGEHVKRFVVHEGADSAKVFAAGNATNNQLYGRDVSQEEIDLVRKRYGIGEEPVVLAVSRLVKQKGIEYLIEAVALLESRPKLLIVGTGQLADDLRALAAARNVDLVLAGGLQPADMPAMYASANVFVLPSVTTRVFRETWGLACNEAMCQGVPVICTDAVGAAAGGLVEHGVTGLVVPERDVVSLSEMIHRLLSDGEYARRIGESGRRRVQTVTYDRMVDAFASAIEYAVSSRGRGGS
ncbi:MAG: glycosyltransferase family 4 protein [Coriobacteriia bacterium]|nr:glycosyltransferase family 4 protein [Coriobacteriia bacterium]